jgi:hypothetical protein
MYGKSARLMRLAPSQWLRGPRARHEAGWIVLDPEGLERYMPLAEAEGPALPLARVREPADAVAFVRRFGLLQHGPGAEPPLREAFGEWLRAANLVSSILGYYRALQAAREGDTSLVQRLETTAPWDWADVIGFEGPLRPGVDPLQARIGILLAALVSKGLEGSQIAVDAAYMTHEGAGPDEFMYDIDTSDLLGFVYHDLAMKITARIPLRTCEQCSRFYPVSDPRQRFCSPECAGRARYRRHQLKLQHQEAPI